MNTHIIAQPKSNPCPNEDKLGQWCEYHRTQNMTLILVVPSKHTIKLIQGHLKIYMCKDESVNVMKKRCQLRTSS